MGNHLDHRTIAVMGCHKAGNLIAGPRDAQHGNARDNFENIARLWSAYLKGLSDPTELDVSAVADLMCLLKTARRLTGEVNPDDYVDEIGYAALGLGLATEGNDVG